MHRIYAAIFFAVVGMMIPVSDATNQPLRRSARLFAKSTVSPTNEEVSFTLDLPESTISSQVDEEEETITDLIESGDKEDSDTPYPADPSPYVTISVIVAVLGFLGWAIKASLI